LIASFLIQIGAVFSSVFGTLKLPIPIIGFNSVLKIFLPFSFSIKNNSWGPTWGDDGYIKIERSESTNDAGVCGIAMQPSFPIV